MPDPTTTEHLKGLILSAKDLRELTDWPGALIEDYLNILDNITTLANVIDVEIDQKIEEIPTDFSDGSVPFADDGLLIEDNANAIFDKVTKVLTLGGALLKNLTASRLTASDGNKNIVSVANLASWIAGTANQITIVNDGDGTITISIPDPFNVPGDLVFVGAGKGLVYGSCYGNHIAWTQAAAVQNTWYNISDADMVDGLLNKVTHDGDGKLTVTEAGVYKTSYSVCFEDDVANDHIEVGIEVSGSGSANAAGQAHVENKFANEEEHLGSSCILDLADNATVEVAIRTTDAGTPTITIHAVNLVVFQIGGT